MQLIYSPVFLHGFDRKPTSNCQPKDDSQDELIFGKDERGPDGDLRLQFEAISQFDEEDKELARGLLEGLILKHQAKQSVARAAARGAPTLARKAAAKRAAAGT